MPSNTFTEPGVRLGEVGARTASGTSVLLVIKVGVSAVPATTDADVVAGPDPDPDAAVAAIRAAPRPSPRR